MTVSAEARLEQKKNAYLLVATMLALTAFQMGISPPGGLWGDDSATMKSIYHHTYNQMPQKLVWDDEIAGSPLMARNCRTKFFLFNVLNHSVLFTSLLATGILLARFEPDCFCIKWTLPAYLIYSTAAMAINYFLVTSCLNSLLPITIPTWAVPPSAVLFAVFAILIAQVAFNRWMDKSWSSMFKSKSSVHVV